MALVLLLMILISRTAPVLLRFGADIRTDTPSLGPGVPKTITYTRMYPQKPRQTMSTWRDFVSKLWRTDNPSPEPPGPAQSESPRRPCCLHTLASTRYEHRYPGSKF